MANSKPAYEDLTYRIIGAAMEVHKTLGPGFLESVYEKSLAVEFELQKIQYQRQVTIDVFYKGRNVKQFIADYVVDGSVIVELKAIKKMTEIEIAQVINYLKASNIKIGLLFNFGGRSLEHKRLAN
jgi:GxxExxY protein